MSFEMTQAQQSAFSDAASGAVSTSDATSMITLVVSSLALTWLLIVFLGYSKKLANREIDILDLLFPLSLAVFVTIVVASILFS